MKAHEIANRLLQFPDVDVYVDDKLVNAVAIQANGEGNGFKLVLHIEGGSVPPNVEHTTSEEYAMALFDSDVPVFDVAVAGYPNRVLIHGVKALRTLDKNMSLNAALNIMRAAQTGDQIVVFKGLVKAMADCAVRELGKAGFTVVCGPAN